MTFWVVSIGAGVTATRDASARLLIGESGMLASTWDPSDWFGCASVASRTNQLTLQICKCRDNVWSLESPIAPSDSELSQDPCFGEADDGFVGLNEAPVNQLRGAVHGEYRRPHKGSEQDISGRVCANSPNLMTPLDFKSSRSLLE